MATLIDFHCHIDLYPDPPALVAECDRLAIRTLAVTTTPRAWPQNKLWSANSTHVRPALGLHPQLVAAHVAELSLFEEYFPSARYIGEVGLDASPQYYASFDAQLRVFRRVLELCASHGGRILSVHSVRATTKLLDLVEEVLPGDRGKVVLHWFSGSKAEARRAAAMGCYFSVNQAMLQGKRSDLVLELPLNKLLTETDGPFTSTQGRPARPADVQATVTSLAARLGRTPDELFDELATNLRTLVSADDA